MLVHEADVLTWINADQVKLMWQAYRRIKQAISCCCFDNDWSLVWRYAETTTYIKREVWYLKFKIVFFVNNFKQYSIFGTNILQDTYRILWQAFFNISTALDVENMASFTLSFYCNFNFTCSQNWPHFLVAFPPAFILPNILKWQNLIISFVHRGTPWGLPVLYRESFSWILLLKY